MTTNQTTTQTDRYLDVNHGRAFSGSSQWGYLAVVGPDDEVLVWDRVDHAFTRCHSLTPRQIARVRRDAR